MTLRAGDPVDAGLAEEINAAWGKATDDRAYPMPDGGYVLIKGGEPLPPKVVEAVTAAIVPPGIANYVSATFDKAKNAAFNDAIESQRQATGRTIVPVIHGMQAIPGGGQKPGWAVGRETAGYNGPSKEEALRVAQAWVDQSPGTRMLIVVDALG